MSRKDKREWATGNGLWMADGLIHAGV